MMTPFDVRLFLAAWVVLATVPGRAVLRAGEAASAAELPGASSNILDRAHASLSSTALSTANWIDSFFGDEDFEEDEASRVRLIIGLKTFLAEETDAALDTRVRLRMRLPRLSRRLQLEISGDPDDEEIDEIRTPEEEAVDRFEGSDMKNFAAELRYFLAVTRQANISLSSGLRYRDGAPVFYAGPRYRQIFVAGNWRFRLQQQVRWFTDNGWEARGRIDAKHPLPGGLFFRTDSGVTWLETDPDNLYHDFNNSIYQPLSNRRMLAYEWHNTFTIQPYEHLDETVLRVRYRQRIWRHWMFFEMAPQVSFPWADDYESRFGVLLRIDMFFGNMM